MPWKRLIVFVASIIVLFAIFFTTTYAQDKDKKAKSGDADDRGRNIVIAQISDTHIGLARAPEASENLRKVVEMINQLNPDAVIVTGDVGERESAWDEAKKIFSGLKPKVFYVPGNHDVSANRPQSLAAWRADFGSDYYEAHIKGATIIALNGQLMGNYDNFNQKKAAPLTSQDEPERMLGWLGKEGGKDESLESLKQGGGSERPQHMEKDAGKLIFAMQHEPIDRASDFPPDDKDYWIIQEPYRSREIEMLHRLGVKHMFVGHWHKGMVFSSDGITSHVAPATSWSPTGDKLGFAMHTITPDGEVKTEFVYLEGADPHPAK
jgi:DNA repair exonuclease SbcCD nuclease subunit